LCRSSDFIEKNGKYIFSLTGARMRCHHCCISLLPWPHRQLARYWRPPNGLRSAQIRCAVSCHRAHDVLPGV